MKTKHTCRGFPMEMMKQRSVRSVLLYLVVFIMRAATWKGARSAVKD